MGNGKKIIISLIILIFGILICILLFNLQHRSRYVNKDNYNKEYTTIGNDNMFAVGDIFDYFFDDSTPMKKIFFSVINETEEDIDMSVYLFYLVDANKNEIGRCFIKGTMEINETDLFPKVAASKMTTDGYLYCKTNNKQDAYLKITYATKGYLNDDGKFKVATKDIYLTLNK